MAKSIYKLKCDQSAGNAGGSNVRFTLIDEGEPAANGKPAVPRSIVTAAQFVFTGKDAQAFKNFDPGKAYTITIE